MAGTRIAIISVYIFQLACLCCLGVYFSIKHGNNNNSRVPLLVDRAGISLLSTSLFDKTENGIVSKLKKQIDESKIYVNLHLAFVQRHPHDPLSLKSLSKALENAITDSIPLSVQALDVVVKVIPSNPISPYAAKPSWMTAQSCDDALIDFQSLTNQIITQEEEASSSYNYNLYLNTGCTVKSIPENYSSKVIISDSGDMLISFHEDYLSDAPSTSNTALQNILQKDVANFITKDFLMPVKKSKASTSSWSDSGSTVLNMVLSLVDEDPASHASSSDATVTMSPKQHHDLLIHALSNSINKSFQRMVQDRLSSSSIFWKVNLFTQSKPYHGQQLTSSDNTSREEFTNSEGGKGVQHVSSAKKARSAFLSSNIAKLPEEHYSLDNDDEFSATWNFIAFVPAEKSVPFYVTDDEGALSTALVIPEKKTTISIINLINNVQNGRSNRTDDEKNVNIYEDAVVKALSYFGSVVRENLGLSAVPPHQQQTKVSGSMTDLVILHHLPTKFGITQWEVDSLERLVWKKKLRETINSLEMTLSLVDWRHGIAVPIESAEQITVSLNHVANAVNMNMDISTGGIGKDDNYVANDVNLAHKLAVESTIDGHMMSLPFMPTEHIAAVFGPLVFPLAFPFVIGFVREWKRFKKLTSS